ncbi:hypothetical protein Tco_1548406 [Tanacetum coccineum]
MTDSSCCMKTVYVKLFLLEVVLKNILKQKAKIEWLTQLGNSNSCLICSKSLLASYQRRPGLTCAPHRHVITNCSGAGWFYIRFLQKGWDIVGHDVCKAIRDFFVNGQLLKELNHTFIALIPKHTEGIEEISDCKVLVEKAQNRIGDWKNKSLSYAGRLQLCKSVISSMHVYWASVLMIPIGILLDIEQLIRGFLWCNGELKRGKAKFGCKFGHLAEWILCRLEYEDIVDFYAAYVDAISPCLKGTIGRLLLAASSYFIWSERNNRTFKQIKRSPEDIRDIIMVTVRLKLITIKFKNTLKVNQLLSTWKMPLNARIYED